MAIKEPRYEKNRLKLHEHIPFRTPIALHIDVCSACNLKCNFCANHSPSYSGDIKRKYGIMELELFERIVDDALQFPDQIISLRLYNVGEPLLNPNLSRMIKYAKDSGKFKKIDTTTNAVALTHELSDSIINAGLDFICFSIEALNSEGYIKVANTKVDFNNIVDNIKYFYDNRRNCKVHIKTMDISVPTTEEKERFYKIFDSMCDSIWIDSVTNVWPDFDSITAVGMSAEKRKNMYGTSVKPLIVCPQPFYNLSVNPDGTVTHCDLDWKNEFIIGDLNKQGLQEIWNSEIVRNTQILHLKGEKNKINICKKCPWPENGCIDDFDEHRMEVLEKIMNKPIKE